MTSNRIIPCLDFDNGKVVKGKKFLEVKEVADPLTLAKKYVADGADELVFYDIAASTNNRAMFLDLIAEIAKEVPDTIYCRWGHTDCRRYPKGF